MQHLPQDLMDRVQLCYKSNIRANARTIAVVLDHIGVLPWQKPETLPDAEAIARSALADAWLAMRRALLNFADGAADVPMNQLLREIVVLQRHAWKFFSKDARTAYNESDAVDVACFVLKRLPRLLLGQLEELTRKELDKLTEKKVRELVREKFA